MVGSKIGSCLPQPDKPHINPTIPISHTNQPKHTIVLPYPTNHTNVVTGGWVVGSKVGGSLPQPDQPHIKHTITIDQRIPYQTNHVNVATGGRVVGGKVGTKLYQPYQCCYRWVSGW